LDRDADRHLVRGQPLYGVAFSPDGQVLAVGDSGGKVGLRDVATGTRTLTLPQGSPVYSVAFSPKRQTLAVGDASGDAKVLRESLWDPNFGSLMGLLCGEVGRNMTNTEWAANVPGQPYQKTCLAYPAGTG
jgi:WD40 repeat protein